MLPLVVRAWLRGSLRVGLEWDESLQPRAFKYVPEDRIGAEALGWEIRPAGSWVKDLEKAGWDVPGDLAERLQKAHNQPQILKKEAGTKKKASTRRKK